MGLFQAPGFAIFNEYPITQPYRSNRLAPFIFTLAIILYALLTTWNVLTQGWIWTYNTQSLSEFNHTDKLITCQPAAISVGNSFFTSPGGSFQWAVGGVRQDPGSAGAAEDRFQSTVTYTGASLDNCVVTSVGISYSFPGQSYVYGVCANCTSPRTKEAALSTIRLCSNFDLSTANLPDWTADVQNELQRRIFQIASYYYRMDFPNGTFPSAAIPPYGQAGSPSPLSATVTPAAAFGLNMYINSFTYSPPASSSSSSTGSYTINGNSVSSLMDVLNSVVLTTSGNSANVLLQIQGIGSIRLGGSDSASSMISNGLAEPTEISNLRSDAVAAADLLIQRAAVDIQGKSIGVGFLCSVKRKIWKDWLPLIAVVLGNNSALFGLGLAILLYGGKTIDERKSGRPSSVITHHSNTRSNKTPREDEDEERLGLVGSDSISQNLDREAKSGSWTPGVASLPYHGTPRRPMFTQSHSSQSSLSTMGGGGGGGGAPTYPTYGHPAQSPPAMSPAGPPSGSRSSSSSNVPYFARPPSSSSGSRSSGVPTSATSAWSDPYAPGGGGTQAPGDRAQAGSPAAGRWSQPLPYPSPQGQR